VSISSDFLLALIDSKLVIMLSVTNGISSSSGSSNGGGGGVSLIQQLACNRLALELERERARELDLRRLGCICTISEQHRGGPPPTRGSPGPETGVNNGLCHGDDDDDGHVMSNGGTSLIEREVQLAHKRELELQ